MPQKYRVKSDFSRGGNFEFRADEVVYRCEKYDYGCASDDTRQTGRVHTSVTKKADGDYPFCTIPVDLLEPVD